MRSRLLWLVVMATTACASSPRALEERRDALELKSGWRLQSSAKTAAKGETISQPGFDASSWYTVTVPNTVVGALVENGTYDDPYAGTNLRSLPGMQYSLGKRFALVDTPAESPFKPSWWYRREIELPAALKGRSLALHFDGINYRANIWINGQQVADAKEVVGVFRRFELDVTSRLRAGEKNAIAVEIFGPESRDLGIMWVDWNPTPPDKNMGLWGAVRLTESGPVVLRNPYVNPALEVPSLARADLTVTAEVWNTTSQPVNATVSGNIGPITFSKAVSLSPQQRTTVRFTPADVPKLRILKPRVWYPYRQGKQELYKLSMSVDVGGSTSDRTGTTFGIQKMTTELTKEGHRLFKVNGKPILIRGGGWASDMLLRAKTKERLEAELRYVREMGLNTVRLEGKLETDEFYDLADTYGILLMPGWCCCDQWEMWDRWDAEDHRVAPESLRDQALRIRNHPSVLAWMNGSDAPPPAKVEQAYLDALKGVEWSKPVLSNATVKPGPVSGPSGVKMAGPYDYVPPNYWLTDTKNGGAFGFATEISPGAAVPPIESLRKMVPAKSLWPINEDWLLHSGGDEFKDLDPFTNALEGRYGKATSAEDYARKAQALTYEGQRAMFEGYARNKYTSTGVIQWMLNNAWPSMIWHLYDYYLRPGGGYFGSKKAMEPLHVQYSYDDHSIALVNDLQRRFTHITVAAEVFDLNLVSKFSTQVTVDIAPDAVVRAIELPRIADLGTTYFVRLKATDAKGAIVSRNFYWLSTQDDELDWKKSTWFMTPTTRHADLTALATLPKTTVTVTPRFAAGSGDGRARVTVTNTGKTLAFQVRLKLIDSAKGEEILPVYWDDNYFELFPGETREIPVVYPRTAGQPRIEVEAWNVQ